MAKQIVFFHGGGSEEDYQADKKLVASLEKALGPEYAIHYPYLPDDGSADFGRRKQIRQAIDDSQEGVILVGHSLGASMLLASLTENSFTKRMAGIFLLATPFWSGDEDWVQPLKLRRNFAAHLDKQSPLFFYQCKDDEEVSVEHLSTYQEQVPWATFRVINTGGHQFNNDLRMVANDIRAVSNR